MRLIILFLILPLTLSAQYKVTWKKVATWGLSAGAGTIWGMREAYHADPTVFERHWGVDKYSFWGSHAWERNYKDNRYLSPEGIPNRHKTEVFGNFGRDFWHTSGYTAGALTLTFSFTIGGSNQPLKYKILDATIGTACFVLPSSLVYKQLRK